MDNLRLTMETHGFNLESRSKTKMEYNYKFLKAEGLDQSSLDILL